MRGGGTSERTGAWVSQPQAPVFYIQSIMHRSRVLRFSVARTCINIFCLIVVGEGGLTPSRSHSSAHQALESHPLPPAELTKRGLTVPWWSSFSDIWRAREGTRS